MRRILISEPGEFDKKSRSNHSQSIAIKMVAKLINKSENKDDVRVIVKKCEVVSTKL